MSLFVVDVEADGPIPGDYSILSFGAIRVDNDLNTFFESGNIGVISVKWNEGALKAIGLSFEDYEEKHMVNGEYAKEVMEKFEAWIDANNKGGRPIFISDNNGFDWMFICWYFVHFLNRNPFGYSSRRIGDIYCGLVKSMRASWKHLRKTKHTHNPVDDAKGNAEALLHMFREMGLK